MAGGGGGIGANLVRVAMFENASLAALQATVQQFLATLNQETYLALEFEAGAAGYAVCITFTR